MPSRISVELTPSSETSSVSALVSPSSAHPTPVTNQKKSMIGRPSISTSPPGGGMDNATMGRPHASPSSTASSFSSASPSSSPSSSTFSLPSTALSMSSSTHHSDYYNNNNNNNGSNIPRSKGKSRDNNIEGGEGEEREQESSSSNGKGVVHNNSHSTTNNQSHDSDESNSEDNPVFNKGKGLSSGKGKSSSDSFDQERPRILTSHGRYATDSGVTSVASSGKSTFYTNTTTPSLSSLSSVEEEEDEDYPRTTVITNATSSSKARPVTVPAKSGKASSGYASASSEGGSGSSSRPRAASSFGQPIYTSTGASIGGSCSGSGSGSGSSSKPVLQRASTGPATFQHSFVASSSLIPPVPTLTTPVAPEKNLQDCQDFSYDNIPDDFDFGDLPFYDTDPRTGTIYGDPHAFTRPHLVPEAYFDLYRFTHDEEDPRRTNVFNKHGALLYYHPGRHIGQEQDSLRMHHSNNAIWVMSGRTSTWGTLTATDMASRRQIKIVQELIQTNKKKAATAATTAVVDPPLTRFVFRWKDDDFVVEYRKHKDQYRITTSQMWKPPQLRPSQTMFHGMGMEVGNPIVPTTLGTPSPFDPDRYLQLISEYRLNSGPVLKRGDFELYNPDTFPLEFRTFLMTLSIVVLDVMRPVNDKLYYATHPEAAHKKPKAVAATGGLHVPKVAAAKGQVIQANFKSTLDTGSNGASSTSLNSGSGSGRGGASTPSLVLASAPATPAVSRQTTTAPEKPVSAPARTNTTPVPKKSKWSSFFRK
ncbi:hypothetical protein BGX29_007107 [Mortierella sp. GBA35]|nr:hypothetical protein BGX29_007107 [Mortierella sp. GBA35]